MYSRLSMGVACVWLWIVFATGYHMTFMSFDCIKIFPKKCIIKFIMNDLDRIAIIIILIQRGILVPVSNIIYEKLRSYALFSLIEITEGKMTYQIYSWK